MSQAKKTIFFVAAAVFSLTLAIVVDWVTRPKPIAGFEKVGQEFYPDFKDPSEATALRVVVYDEDTASAKPFMVEYKDGAWRIPSHHNYPADAKERLARTAASLIGIKREALASRRPTDHARFGVIDPLDESNPSLKGRGHRITLFKNGNILVDFIIGKKVEGTENEYYIRRADENEVYRAKLNLDVSTKFADWVEPNLLKLDRYDLVKIAESKPIIDPTTGRMVGEETFELTRNSSTDDWKLAGLNEQTEELDKSKITSLEFALQDLRLVGVRPKPQYEGKPLLTADLTFNPPDAIKNNPQALQVVIEQLRNNLAERGFFLGPDQRDPKKTRVYSREGELTAYTNKGVVYHLHFGNVFEGTEEEIEIGKSSKKEAKSKDQSKKGSEQSASDQSKSASKDAAGEKTEQEKKESSESDSGTKLSKSRYLFVRVEFDESLLGKKPVAPKKPKKPAGVDIDKLGADEALQEDKGKSAEERKKEQAEKEKLRKQYEEALKKYEEAKSKYEQDLKEYNRKVKEGKEKVAELNERFANWYFVISEDSFKKLRLTRADLVKPKKQEEKKEEQAGSQKETSPKATAKQPAGEAQQNKAGAAQQKAKQQAKEQQKAKPKAGSAAAKGQKEKTTGPAKAKPSGEGASAEGVKPQTEQPASSQKNKPQAAGSAPPAKEKPKTAPKPGSSAQAPSGGPGPKQGSTSKPDTKQQEPTASQPAAAKKAAEKK